MAEELNVNGLKQMKRAEYIKHFKNRSVWKKTRAVIVFVDYKLEGKKTTVAIPFRKEAEMKLEMKRVKSEKLHPMKKSAGGKIFFENDLEEGRIAKLEITRGGVKPELLQLKAEDLFMRIQTTLKVALSEDAEIEETVDDPADESESVENLSQLIADLEKLIKETSTAIKEKIQAIPAAIKEKLANESQLELLLSVQDQILDMKEIFDQLDEKSKEKYKAQVEKILALVEGIQLIKTALENYLNKGGTPGELPDSIRTMLEKIVEKIKEAKAAKKDPEKFRKVVKIINTTFDALMLALQVLKPQLAQKVKESKVFQFIEAFLDSLEDSDESEEESSELEIPSAIQKLLDEIQDLIKKAEAVRNDLEKFKKLADLVQTSFENLMKAINAVDKKIAEAIKKSLVYKLILEFIESLNSSSGTEVNEEDKKQLDQTMKELELLFSSVGIPF